MTFWDQLLQYFISGIYTGSIYAIIGLGLTIVFNVSRVVNFSQGEYAMVGSMVAASLWDRGNGMHWISAIPIGIAAAILLGVVSYRLVIYPARKANIGVLMLLTLGISIVVKAVAVLIWGTDRKSFPAFTGDAPIYLGNAFLYPQTLWILGACLVLAAALYIFFMYTVPGKIFRACAINEVVARMVGCNPVKQSLIAFAMAAALGGLAGIFITPLVTTQYSVGLNLTIGGFMAAVIGGMNRVEGVLMGGFAIGIVEAMAAGFWPTEWGGSGYKSAIALGVFLVVLYFRRHGLMGAEE